MMPEPLIIATTIEKMIPDTTGAGIAYLRSNFEWFTIARPRKITMAAKPRVVRYSNLKLATAPSAAGV